MNIFNTLEEILTSSRTLFQEKFLKIYLQFLISFNQNQPNSFVIHFFSLKYFQFFQRIFEFYFQNKFQNFEQIINLLLSLMTELCKNNELIVQKFLRQKQFLQNFIQILNNSSTHTSTRDKVMEFLPHLCKYPQLTQLFQQMNNFFPLDVSISQIQQNYQQYALKLINSTLPRMREDQYRYSRTLLELLERLLLMTEIYHINQVTHLLSDLSDVLNTFSFHHNDPINSLAVDETHFFTTVIFHCCFNFLDEMTIQSLGQSILSHLTHTKTSLEHLGKEGICLLLHEILKRHINHVELCSKIYSAMTVFSRNIPENRDRLGGSSGCHLLMTAYLQHKDDAELTNKCCQVIRNINSDSLENQNEFGRIGLCSHLVSSLKDYKADEVMISSLVKTLLSLCTQSKTNTHLLMNSQLFQQYLQILQDKYSNIKISQSITNLIIHLCTFGDETGTRVVFQNSFLFNLVNILHLLCQNFHHPIECFKSILMLVAYLLYNIPGVKSHLLETKLLTYLNLIQQEINNDLIRRLVDALCQYLNSNEEVKKQPSPVMSEQMASSIIISKTRNYMNTRKSLIETTKTKEFIQHLLVTVNQMIDLESLMEAITMSIQTGNSELALKTIRRIRSCCIPTASSMLRELISYSQTLIKFLSSFLSLELVQSTGLDILLLYETNLEDLKALSKEGVCLLLLEILKRHINHVELCSKVYSAMTVFSRNIPENRNRLGGSSGCHLLMTAYLQHKDDAELTNKCCQVIRNMSSFSSDNQNEFGRIGLCAHLVSSMNDYKADEVMMSVIIKSLMSLITKNTANVIQITSQEYFKLYFHILQRNQQNSKIFKDMCMLLVGLLMNGGESVMTQGINSRIFETIDTLLNESMNSSIKETCVMFFAHFTINTPHLQPTLKEVGIIKTCQNLIRNQSNAPYIQVVELILRSLQGEDISSTQIENQEVAAQTITHHAAQFSNKRKQSIQRNELNSKVQRLLLSIESSQDIDECITSLKLSYETGSCQLASKTMSRIHAMLSQTATSSPEFRTTLNSKLLSELDFLISMMTSFLSIISFQVACLEVFLNLSWDSTNYEKFTTLGHEVLFNVLHRHLPDPIMCNLIADFCCKLAQNSANSRSLICQPQYVEIIISVMTTHCGNQAVMKAFSKVVQYLCKNSENNQEIFWRAGICEKVSRYLSRHNSNEEAIASIGAMIASLCSEKMNQNNRVTLSSRNYLDLYLRTLAQNPSKPKICKRVCLILVDLCGKGSGPVAEELNKSGVARELCQLLSVGNPANLSPEVLQAMVMLGVHFSVNVPPFRATLVSAGMVEIMTRFTGSEWSSEVQKAAALAIRKLTGLRSQQTR